ncbi:nuclear transport factor 2 family protein [Streptomyces sp. NPDC058220]|uniref:nuclear transport factor 2 family protein n=1 Tax=Streptomyces sp. NPDC058220 TaxID=3346387 RepID=UPI0036E1A17D
MLGENSGEQAGQGLSVLGRQRFEQVVLHLIEHPVHASQLPGAAPGEGHLVAPSVVRVRGPVADLFARLANLLDECRHEDAGTVYHDDVVVRSPRGELHGLDEVTAHLKRSQVEGEHTQHVHGDVLVQVDGDRAKATANQLTYFYRNGEAPHRTSGLRVACTAVRTSVGWRFSESQITLAWMQEK